MFNVVNNALLKKENICTSSSIFVTKWHFQSNVEECSLPVDYTVIKDYILQ